MIQTQTLVMNLQDLTPVYTLDYIASRLDIPVHSVRAKYDYLKSYYRLKWSHELLNQRQTLLLVLCLKGYQLPAWNEDIEAFLDLFEDAWKQYKERFWRSRE